MATAPRTDTRERLLAEAHGILAERGLGALTLRSIARAAGVSHMAPYSHFDDVQALLAALAADGFDALTEAMRDAARDHDDPGEVMWAIGRAYIDRAREAPALYRLMFGPTVVDHRAHDALIASSRAAFRCCLEATAACRGDSPEAPSRDSETAAITVWAQVHGLASLLIDGRVGLALDEPQDDEALIEASLTRLSPEVDGGRTSGA